MKKIAFLKFAIVFFFVATFNTSCTDLEETLYDEVAVEDFFKTEEEFIAALGAAYTGLYGFYGTPSVIGAQEVSSDEMMVPTRGADWDDGGHWRRIHLHQYTPEDPVTNGAWGFCFGGISTCNRLIFTFQELNAPGSDVFIGELETLRAFYYLLLLDLYGNVPIVTEFDVPADFAPATEDRTAVFNFVESEIKRNLPKLNPAADANTYGRVNQNVANAMLAKLYLNAEAYTGTARWSDAVAACDAIINTGAYGLATSYGDNFSPNNGPSVIETIFAIPYDRVNAKGFVIPQQTLHYASQGTYKLQAQPWNGWCSLEEFYNSYEDGDVRKRQNFIVGPQFNADGSPATDAGADDPDPQVNFTPEVNELGPNCQRQAGARVGKYPFEIGQNPDMNNDFPLYRYADILMTKAEAMWRMDSGSAEALDLVNQVRARAGVEAFNALTAENLLAERGREFFFEAHRRTDLIRFGRYNDEWFAKRRVGGPEFAEPARFDPEVALYPIPKAQLDANANLKQNPGY